MESEKIRLGSAQGQHLIYSFLSGVALPRLTRVKRQKCAAGHACLSHA